MTRNQYPLFWTFTFCFLTFLLPSVPVFSAENRSLSFEEGKTALVLKENGRPVWQYNFATVLHPNVPAKIGCQYAGCYVHPLYGMNGEILTDNTPKDHFHHHGVFWTWPHVTLYEKSGAERHLDLWLGNTAIRQYFVRWLDRSISSDGRTAELIVENGWYVDENRPNSQADRASGEKVMKEIVRIKTGAAEVRDGISCRTVDFYFTWTPIGRTISLRGAENKSYGGLTVRFRPPGPKDPATKIRTSLGPAADDIPETPLKWCDYTSAFGDSPKEKSGAAIFVPADHPDYPPTWMVRHYGMIAVGWPGVAERKFPADKEIKLHYRIWIHDGSVDQKILETLADEYRTAK